MIGPPPQEIFQTLEENPRPAALPVGGCQGRARGVAKEAEKVRVSCSNSRHRFGIESRQTITDQTPPPD